MTKTNETVTNEKEPTAHAAQTTVAWSTLANLRVRLLVDSLTCLAAGLDRLSAVQDGQDIAEFSEFTCGLASLARSTLKDLTRKSPKEGTPRWFNIEKKGVRATRGDDARLEITAFLTSTDARIRNGVTMREIVRAVQSANPKMGKRRIENTLTKMRERGEVRVERRATTGGKTTVVWTVKE